MTVGVAASVEPLTPSPAARRRTLRVPLTNWRVFCLGLVCGAALVFGGRAFINETALADRLVAPLIVRDTAGPADVVVVMGAGTVGQCGVNLNSVRRVLTGVRAWRSGRAPHVLFTGGSAFDEPSCPVAVAMASLAREVGMPESSIHVERGSRTTRENGELSAPMLRRLGASTLLVVTDLLHMKRAAGTFEQLGFRVERASVPVYEGHADNVSMLAAAAREAAALAYYRMRGWIGRAGATRAEPGEPMAEAMQLDLKYPAGPVVVLGASYAGGWDLKALGGRPVINRGVSGQQSFEMLERFDRDVVAAHPRAVVLWGFINDIFRAPGGSFEAVMPRARESFTRMIALARANGIEPILATEVTVRPPASWSETIASWLGSLMGKEAYQDRINRHVVSMNQWLVDLARREGVLLLDLQSVVSEQGGRRRREFAQHDGSHISPAGYKALTAYAVPVLEKHLTSR